jgi:3-oxosteroid 1-dehydrogenase
VKPNPCLRPLEAPFYAIEIRLGNAGTNAGLVINGHGQVRHLRGHPIAGLYAAGNAAANQVGGLWYNAGMMNARGMTFGYLGARHALG